MVPRNTSIYQNHNLLLWEWAFLVNDYATLKPPGGKD